MLGNHFPIYHDFLLRNYSGFFNCCLYFILHIYIIKQVGEMSATSLAPEEQQPKQQKKDKKKNKKKDEKHQVCYVFVCPA